MIAFPLLAVSAALALQPPVGWTAAGPDRAVLIPSDPGRGELRELSLEGQSIEPLLLVTALGQLGLQVKQSNRDADGTVNISFASGQLGRARVHTTASRATWYVVIADHDHADALDADALLTALIPRSLPPTLQRSAEVLPAGRDGSLWDPVASETPAPTSTDPWGAPVAAAPSAWSKRKELVGIWGGRVGGPWDGVELIVTLDATGRLRIEERSSAGSEITEGTWSATGEQLRLESYTAAPLALPYRLERDSLHMSWEGQPVALFPRR